ncbi:protein kilB [Streptomyces jumonjinensis]|uniref:protein kilB n=1 Tax=Streptomyces jumonjinensis TaxID=1945 RepID=UPI0037A51937
MALIAVAGTLLGSVSTAVLQQRAVRADRAEARSDAVRRDRITAIAALVAALAEHRLAMWAREDLRLSGTDGSAYQAARVESHATRAAVTAPLTTVAILAPDLADAAHDAAHAAYALRGAADAAMLAGRRADAIGAAERLVHQAAQLA